MAKTKRKPSKRLFNLRFDQPALLLLASVFTLVGVIAIVLTRASTNNAINPTDEISHIRRINDYRASKGLSRLDRTQCLTDIAREWSRHVATRGGHHNGADWHTEYGSSGYIKDPRNGARLEPPVVYHTHPSYLLAQITQMCGDRLGGNLRVAGGENIAPGHNSEEAAFNSFLGSPPHRANIEYKPLNFIGVGDYVNSDGKHYITQLFAYCVTDSGSKCGGEWASEPSDNCTARGRDDGLLSSGNFELKNYTYDVNWKNVRTLNTWHTWRSDGSNINRISIGAPHGDCWVMYNKDPSNGGSAVTQVVRGTAGVSYNLSAYYRYASGGGNQSLYLDFLDSNYQRIRNYIVSTTQSTSWRQLSITRTAPSGTRYIRVILYGSGSGDNAANFFWDDVRLIKN